VRFSRRAGVNRVNDLILDASGDIFQVEAVTNHSSSANTMPDKAKFIERREQLEAYRKSQAELGRLANEPDGEPLIKVLTRIIRKQEKKKTFTGHA
jgi:hypothetical protein